MPIHKDKNTHKSKVKKQRTPKGLTKKQIRRFKKATLISMIPGASKKISKNALVDMFFKDKKLRSSTQAPAKRVLSAKQMKNLERFKIQRNFKNETTIKQAPQFMADLRTIEHSKTKIAGNVPDEFKKKKLGEGKGILQKTQVERLKQQAKTNTREEDVRARELIDSTLKSSDIDDRRIKDAKGQPNKKRLETAEGHAKSTADKRFGEGAVVSEEASMDSILSLMSLPVPDLVAKLKMLEKSNPNAPIIIVIKGLLEKKKSN